MRLHAWRAAIVATLAFGGLLLFGLTAMATSLSDHVTDSVGLPAGAVVQVPDSLRQEGVPAAVYPSTDVSARRVISDPGINASLVVVQNGREVLVTGHFTCARGEDYEIQTAVTQSATGALARGKTQGRCSGRADQFESATWVYDEALFEPGAAQACAMIITRTQNKVTDVFQWCRKDDVELKTGSSSS